METNPIKPFAVITGASSGIGYELAKQFAENGFDLLVTSESGRLDEAALRLHAHGTEVRSIKADLSSYEGVETLYREINAIGRPVDAIAINAGIGVSGDFSKKTELDEELKLIQLNIVSVVHLTKRVVKDMLKQGRGRILFTSSIAATMPAPFLAVYAASKSFVQSFAEAIRSELKDTGITVTALMPGATETNFFIRAGMLDTPVGQAKKDDPADVAQAGFNALMAGADHVVAGSLKNKVQATLAKFLPETAKAALHRRETEPQSRN